MSATNPILPILAPIPEALEPFFERLRQLGYLDFEVSSSEQASQADFPLEPQVALAPLSAMSDLNAISRALAMLQLRFPTLQGFAVLNEAAPISNEDVVRAGFVKLDRLPYDEDSLVDRLFEFSPVEANSLTLDHLLRIRIEEIEHERKLPFDVYLYLSMNRRAILYFEKDRTIDPTSLRKFKLNPHYGLYVRRVETKEYYEFCRQRDIDDGPRRFADRLRSGLGELLSADLLKPNDIALAIDDLRAIVGKSSDADVELNALIARFASSRMSHFTHARNVSAYCAIFGEILGVSDPETLRLGGLLHDIGLGDLPISFLERDPADYEGEDEKIYRHHSELGQDLVNARRLPLPPDVLDMILYHHEAVDGSGFPMGSKAIEIPAVAKVCAFADEFDRLTSAREGKRQLSAREAVERISGLDGHEPSPYFDPQFHAPLVAKLAPPRPQTGKIQTKSEDAKRRPTGTVKVREEKAVDLRGATTSFAELLARFKTKEIDLNQWVSKPTARLELQDLRIELREHWRASDVE